MDLSFSAEDEAFRTEIREWLAAHLTGEWAELKGLGGPGRDHEMVEERLAWNRHLAAHGWTCVGWPTEYGGRGGTPDREQEQAGEDGVADHVAAGLAAQHRLGRCPGAGDGEPVARSARLPGLHHS